MNIRSDLFRLGVIVLALLLAWSVPTVALAQGAGAQEEGDEPEQEADEEEKEAVSEVIFVTGSRIATTPATLQRAPVVELSDDQLKRSGLTNLGATLQQLPAMGSAISARDNVPGNSGFPQDGNGIGAGAIELSLRNLGAKRTLVLVDGRRWVAGASASGVPIAVDLNTLPAAVIDRIEVLQDGASAIYGSDAIGGVVNVITLQDFDGMRFAVQNGEFASEGDGTTTEVSGVWGGGTDKTRILVGAAVVEEGGVFTSDRAQSAFPNPFATSCNVPGTLCSSFTPQGRFILGPNFGFQDMTLDDGVLNDGGANKPVFVPGDPNGGDFHAFSSADRFNYNGNRFNYLKTPNERFNIFTHVDHELSDNVDFFIRAAYTNRQSATRAAPEPLCLGDGCGNRIAENIFIHRDQIYNPFGVDLSVANGNLLFFGRRPLESGPRIFEQDVNTYFGTAGLEGEFRTAERTFAWDAYFSYGDNRGFQQKFNSHSIARLQVALGDPAVCAATPNCVPFNFFGGQGPNGQGSITQEMLDFVGYTQRDFSEQTLLDYGANITGDLVSLSTGTISFAAGATYREQKGSFQPDPIAARGETAGIPSAPTVGGFNVTELYAEVSIPVVVESSAIDYLEFNLAGRSSDYSTFGSESTYKFGVLYRPISDLSFRGSISTGLRAPGIGELFGGAAREDFTFLDPCADVLGVIGSANGGRDAPQPANIIANCAALGVPVNFAQRNPQLSAVSAGNPTLIPEESDNTSFGIVYSPARSAGASAWSVSLDFYDIEIDNAIQGRDPGDVINACVDTLDPFFCD
ncbi:MAG: TonB-dependent receptor, partial [Thermoanaerobaculia bacterium]|nr:TonB-dependent receptor [Thermoanaerobaculia bacterium]